MKSMKCLDRILLAAMCTKRKLMAAMVVTVLLMVLVLLQQDTEVKSIQSFPRVFSPRWCKVQDSRTCLPNPFVKICQKANISMSPYYEVTSPGVYSDILLILVFNHHNYNLVPLTEFMYRRHFNNILYCGDSKFEHWDPFQKTFPRQLDYAQVHFYFGQLGYMCMMEAVKRNYSVKGYLHLSDDVLLNMWSIRHFPRNVPWFYEDVRNATRNQTHVPDFWKLKEWYPWSDKRWGTPPLARTWQDLEDMASSGTPEERSKMSAYLNNLATSLGSREKAYYYPSDVWYLPAFLGKQFADVMEIFLRHKVYHEIAIPTVLHGLGSPVLLFSGIYLWYEDRANFTDVYSPSHVFLHPFKLKTYVDWKKGPYFLCRMYLPRILRDLETSMTHVPRV